MVGIRSTMGVAGAQLDTKVYDDDDDVDKVLLSIQSIDGHWK